MASWIGQRLAQAEGQHGLAQALAVRGALALDAGDAAGAVALFGQAVAAQPGDASAHCHLGAALRLQGHPRQALDSLDRALALAPPTAAALSNRGNALLDLDRPDEALAMHRQALALAPGQPQVLRNLGVALLAAHQPDEALACFEALGRADPRCAEAPWFCATAHQMAGRGAAAVAALEAGVARFPQDAALPVELAGARLRVGDFARGWAAYETRFAHPAWRDRLPAPGRPPWLGAGPLAGRTLLLHAEQGLGDALQFCRYAPLAAARGARVLLRVAPALAPLLATLEGVDALVEEGRPLPAFDLHCPLMSLPLAFGTRLETVPAAVPYLRADPARVAAWRGWLGPAAELRVGIAWSGSPTFGRDRQKSLPLDRFLQALPPGCEAVSLLPAVRERDRPALAAHPQVRHAGAALRDFADVAALCALVDVVVSIDTAAAHVAGALGRPCRLLVDAVGDWRWLEGRADSPWYPTMTLHREDPHRGWEPTLAAVRQALAACAAAGAAHG